MFDQAKRVLEVTKTSDAKQKIVFWLSGGPGCSSQMALLALNGPCREKRVNDNGEEAIALTLRWSI
jgi:carboxypeptidase C (cathepsin A)